MPSILLIETATDICSIAVATDGAVVSHRSTGRSYSHSEVITVFIEECLAEAELQPADLAAVAVTSGPGSYTALRIGASTAKGLCYGLDIPLISVDTMRSMAMGVRDSGVVADGDIIIPLLDARRMEVYRTVYDADLREIEQVAPIILDGESFAAYQGGTTVHLCGDGAEKSKDVLRLTNTKYHEIECSATYMVSEAFAKLEAGELEDIAYFTPFYFKAPNITVQKKNILLR